MPPNRLIILLCLMVLPHEAMSQTLYRYQDDKGRWHFTDKKPLTSKTPNTEAFTLKQTNRIDLSHEYKNVVIDDALCRPDQERQALYYRNKGGYIGKKGAFDVTSTMANDRLAKIHAANGFFAPIEVNLHIEKNKNTHSEPALPQTFLIPPQSHKKLAELSPIQQAPWNFAYRYQYQLGDSKAVHDSDCYYLPPVPPDKDFVVTQAFNGSFSHNSAYSRYAVDIAMDVGTPIYAARSGIVIRRKTEYLFAGLNKSFLSRANSVSILHSDGTISIYAHLKFRSILVKEGMKVKAGEVIAKSGNTGYSTGPHLHFEVVKNDRLRWYSQPFKFMLNGKMVTPKPGMILRNQTDNNKIIADIENQSKSTQAPNTSPQQ